MRGVPMKTCPNCMAESNDNDLFCRLCGFKFRELPITEPSGGVTNMEAAVGKPGFKQSSRRGRRVLFFILIPLTAALFLFFGFMFVNSLSQRFAPASAVFDKALADLGQNLFGGSADELAGRMGREDFELSVKATDGRMAGKENALSAIAFDFIKQGKEGGFKISGSGMPDFDFTALFAFRKLFMSLESGGIAKAAYLDLPEEAGETPDDWLLYLSPDKDLQKRLAPLKKKFEKYQKDSAERRYSEYPGSFTDLEDGSTVKATAYTCKVNDTLNLDAALDVIRSLRSDPAFYGELRAIAKAYGRDGAGDPADNLEKMLRKSSGPAEGSITLYRMYGRVFAMRISGDTLQTPKVHFDFTLQQKQAGDKTLTFLELTGTLPGAAPYRTWIKIDTTPKENGSESLITFIISGNGNRLTLNGSVRTEFCKTNANEYTGRIAVDFGNAEGSPGSDKAHVKFDVEARCVFGSISLKKNVNFDVGALERNSVNADSIAGLISAISPDNLDPVIGFALEKGLLSLTSQNNILYLAVNPPKEEQTAESSEDEPIAGDEETVPPQDSEEEEPPPSEAFGDTFWEPLPLSEGLKDNFKDSGYRYWSIYNRNTNEQENNIARFENGALALPYSYNRSLISRPFLIEKGDIIEIRRKIKVKKTLHYQGSLDIASFDPENGMASGTSLFKVLYNAGYSADDIPEDAFMLAAGGSGNQHKVTRDALSGRVVEETFVIDTGTGKCKWILNGKEKGFSIKPPEDCAMFVEFSNSFASDEDNMLVYNCSITKKNK
jgi:hypothetical protein